MDYAQMSDEQLARLSQDGDTAAQDFLIDKYKPMVRRRSRSYFLAGADHEDIIQEGMIGLYKAIRDYSPDKSSFYAFAVLCVTRQIFSAVKTANRQKHLPLNNYVSLNKSIGSDEGSATLAESLPASSTTEPEQAFIGKEGKTRIEEYMDGALSQFETQVLYRFLQGESYAQIAERLETSAKSVDNALQRIRRKLGELLRQL